MFLLNDVCWTQLTVLCHSVNSVLWISLTQLDSPVIFTYSFSKSACVCEQGESSQEPVWTGPQRHAAQVWLILHVLFECSVYIVMYLTEVRFDLIFFRSDVFAITWLVKISWFYAPTNVIYIFKFFKKRGAFQLDFILVSFCRFVFGKVR